MSYSIAIRTLGTGGEAYCRQLESIARQTVAPERVMVYIAEGYPRPAFTVGREEYVAVPKGMLAQRALPYREISSDCILLLDDDVELAPDTAERLLAALEANDADCVAADTFQNHRMSLPAKIKAAIAAGALPSCRARKAFRLRRSGAFTYANSPAPGACMPSDTAAGPCSLWRRMSLLATRLADEEWVEQDGFAYGEDMIYYHKLVVNGGRLFVLFDSGAVHLDSGNASAAFRSDAARRMYVRAKNSAIIRRRCIYEPAPSRLTALCQAARTCLDTLVVAALMRPRLLRAHLRGLRDARRFMRSDAYRKLPPYKLK